MPTTAEVEFPHFQPYRSPSNSLDMIVQLYLCIYFAICCAEAATKAYLHLPIREPESRYWSARQRPARKDPAEGETQCRFNYFNILIIIRHQHINLLTHYLPINLLSPIFLKLCTKIP